MKSTHDVLDREPLTVLPAGPLTALPANSPLLARPVDEPPLDVLPVRRRTVFGAVRYSWNALTSATEWVFGLMALVVGLAFLAAIPVAGLVSLGYLLEAAARIARNAPARREAGRAWSRWWLLRCWHGWWAGLADGLPGVRPAARFGGAALATAVILVPLLLVSSLYGSARIIDPDGTAARLWGAALTVLTVVAGCHLLVAGLRGGRVHYFFWPIGNLIWLATNLPGGRFYTEPRDQAWDFVVSLRLPYFFWLGFRGFVVGLAWLAIPITLLAVGRKAPVAGILGGWYFGLLLLVLPFLQVRLAVENRFRAGFELGPVLVRFARAPWAFALAQFFTLLLALPLYFFKIELIPREVGGVPSFFFVLTSLVFVSFIFPTRLLAGWAYGRSGLRTRARNPVFLLSALTLMVPATAVYVLFVILTQYISWKGFASLYEQHPFLLPIPFLMW